MTEQQRPHPQIGMSNPEFESLVQWLIKHFTEQQLSEMRSDFHARLRLTLTHPEDSELIEDLWDFFYDWCVFEKNLCETVPSENAKEAEIWTLFKNANIRGLYSILRLTPERIKLKDMYKGDTLWVVKRHKDDFLGLSKGDIIEARLVSYTETQKNGGYSFARRPSFHPTLVHSYIQKKVKQFRKLKDFATYQSWLWLLVGMYLKHRIYHHMPMDKIYDDNSRI